MGHSYMYAVVGMVVHVCLPIPYVPTCRGTHSTVHVGLLYMYLGTVHMVLQ